MKYKVQTRIYSYFSVNENGKLKLRNGLPYKSEKEYILERTIQPKSTAVVVMDPWIDMADDDLNVFFGNIINTRIIPLVSAAVSREHPIIIITNDPKKKYNTRIHPDLNTLVQTGNGTILYHQNIDSQHFASLLRSMNIQFLIYMGFASNMCVIGRPMGMISMKYQGFNIFFVPGASAAMEISDTWKNQYIHNATTRIISQWVAEIIDYEDLLSAL